jgi:hypothetical protein
MRFLTAALAIILVALLPGLPVGAQEPATQPTPADYLLGPDEIPPGFVHDSADDQEVTAEGVVNQRSEYVRSNPEVGPDDVTKLFVGAEVAPSTTLAASAMQTRMASFQSLGWSFEPLNGLIGEEAFVGRGAFAEGNPRPAEGVMVFFRVGAVLGNVVWADFADLPNYDNAMAIARIIESKMWTTPWGEISAPRPTL